MERHDWAPAQWRGRLFSHTCREYSSKNGCCGFHAVQLNLQVCRALPPTKFQEKWVCASQAVSGLTMAWYFGLVRSHGNCFGYYAACDVESGRSWYWQQRRGQWKAECLSRLRSVYDSNNLSAGPSALYQIQSSKESHQQYCHDISDHYGRCGNAHAERGIWRQSVHISVAAGRRDGQTGPSPVTEAVFLCCG